MTGVSVGGVTPVTNGNDEAAAENEGVTAIAQPSPLTVLPTEDAGAQTQGRFSWQHHCIAADCLNKANTTPNVRIICEMHEDYLVDCEGLIDLVSCKHRESSRGPWSLQEICGKGGLAHLYSRWSSFTNCTARLLTNAGLKTGSKESSEVLAGIRSDAPDRDAAVTLLARALILANPKGLHAGIPTMPTVKGAARAALQVPADFHSKVSEFAKVLRVVDSLPSREHIRSIHIQEVAAPYFALRSPGATGVEDGYDRLVRLIAGKNSIDPLKADYGNWLSGETRGSAAAMVRARTVSINDIETCFEVGRASRVPLESHPDTDHTRLRIKLLQGGLRTTRINAAERLREAWLAAWAKRRLDLPGDEDARYDLEARILQFAGDIETLCCAESPGTEWGNRMYRELWDRIENQRYDLVGTLPLSTEHLVGLAMDLTEQCQIWFSDPFDVDGILDDLEAEGQHA